MRRTHCTSCRKSRSWRARNISLRCASSSSISRPTATSTAAAPSASGVPRWGCCGTSIRPGRYSAISRAAPRCPSFGESVSPNFLNPTFPTIPFFLIKPQIATTYEIGTRGKRPDFSWELVGYRANIRDELQCQYSSFGNCNVTNLDRTIHQGIEAGAGAAIVPQHLRHGKCAGQDLAQPRLYVQRLPVRQRSDLRQQPAAGRAASLPAGRSALQAPEWVLCRPQSGMGAAILFCR